MGVALTFDDGPGPSTERILEILAAAGVRATFFLLGRNIDPAPWSSEGPCWSIVQRIIREGHRVGNHTFSHLGPSGAAALGEELAQTDALLIRAAAAVNLQLEQVNIPFRLPYGIDSGAVPDPRLDVLARLGRPHVGWTADFGDWRMSSDDGAVLAARMLDHVEAMRQTGRDAVLTLHDSGPGDRWGYHRDATVLGLLQFIDAAKQRGHRFLEAWPGG